MSNCGRVIEQICPMVNTNLHARILNVAVEFEPDGLILRQGECLSQTLHRQGTGGQTDMLKSVYIYIYFMRSLNLPSGRYKRFGKINIPLILRCWI